MASVTTALARSRRRLAALGAAALMTATVVVGISAGTAEAAGCTSYFSSSNAQVSITALSCSTVGARHQYRAAPYAPLKWTSWVYSTSTAITPYKPTVVTYNTYSR